MQARHPKPQAWPGPRDLQPSACAHVEPCHPVATMSKGLLPKKLEKPAMQTGIKPDRSSRLAKQIDTGPHKNHVTTTH